MQTGLAKLVVLCVKIVKKTKLIVNLAKLVITYNTIRSILLVLPNVQMVFMKMRHYYAKLANQSKYFFNSMILKTSTSNKIYNIKKLNNI